MSDDQISAGEAAILMDIPYSRLLQWEQRGKYGLKAAKVGWGLVFSRRNVSTARKAMDDEFKGKK